MVFMLNLNYQLKLINQNNIVIEKTIKKFLFILSLVVLFDVPKPEMKFDEDIITLTQIKCKRLLAETKEKMSDLKFDFDFN
jgi:hypothetical protein